MNSIQDSIHNFTSKTIRTGNRTAIWFFTALSYLFELAVFFWGTVLLCLAFFSAGRYMWLGYVDTYVGRKFVGFFGSRAGEIHRLLDLDLMDLSLNLCLTALKTCLFIALCCRLTSLDRYFYLHRNPLYRFIVWGVLCSAAAAYNIDRQLDSGWPIAVLSALLVSLPLFQECFKISSELLPDLRIVLAWGLAGLAGKESGPKTSTARKKDPVEIHNMKVKKGRSAKAVYLDFILRNTAPQQGRLSGYAAVVLKSNGPDRKCLVYPAEARLQNGEVERFYEGHRFRVHGFVQISAMVPLPDPDFRVDETTVFIFGSDGELLLKTNPPRPL